MKKKLQLLVLAAVLSAGGIASAAEKRPQTPFFLYLAVNTVHGSGRNDSTLADGTPLHVPGRPFPAEGLSWQLRPEPRELRNTWIDPLFRGLPPAAARYATAVKRLDDALGDLLALLDRLGIAQDTMVVFTSDNGPADEYGADPRTFGSAGATAACREFAARKAPVRGLLQMTRSGRFVALRTRIGEKGGGKVRLYDVVADPFQRNDLSGRPEHAARLRDMSRVLDERLRR